MKKSNKRCKGYRDIHGDFDCEYKFADKITCDQCKYGPYNKKTNEQSNKK